MSAVEPMSALHAERVAGQVVVATLGADQTPGRLHLHPSVTLASVPDAISRPDDPIALLPVLDPEPAHLGPELSNVQAALISLLEQEAVTSLRQRERIHGHVWSI